MTASRSRRLTFARLEPRPFADFAAMALVALFLTALLALAGLLIAKYGPVEGLLMIGVLIVVVGAGLLLWICHGAARCEDAARESREI